MEMKLNIGDVWLATLVGVPDLMYKFEIIAPVSLSIGTRWLGFKLLDEAEVLHFPGNQMYLFAEDGLSEGDSYNGTKFQLYQKSKTKPRYRISG